MFGWFKRKADATSALKPAGVGMLGTVIMRRSTMARRDDRTGANEVVEGVVSFVHTMLDSGLYNRSEIPAAALQAYHAAIYLGQVNNGGHSQFIGNYLDDLDNVLMDVRAGLAAMGAQAQLEIFELVATWIAQHPEEVTKQTGFDGGKAPLLGEFDRLFFKVEEEMPMTVRSARWIASWPNLKVVEDADYEEAIQQCAMMNPLREARLIARSIGNLARQMTELPEVGVGLACASASPMEIKSMMLGGWTMEVEGEQCMALRLRTNENKLRFCVVTSDWAALYEYVEDDNPTAGRKLSHVPSETIATVIELAKKHRAPAALDLLLRTAEIDPAGAVVSPMSILSKPDDTAVWWAVAVGGQRLLALSIPDGIVLTRPGEERSLAVVRAPEISEHAARHVGSFV